MSEARQAERLRRAPKKSWAMTVRNLSMIGTTFNRLRPAAAFLLSIPSAAPRSWWKCVPRYLGLRADERRTGT